jgi:glycosyltransferase involved in cell wall biosynthesis
MNIAIFIRSDLQDGGGFQYEYMVLEILKKYHKNNDINLKFYCLKKSIINDYKGLNLPIKHINENIFRKIHRFFFQNVYAYKILKKFGLGVTHIEKKLHKDNIDLVYFTSPNGISQGLVNLSYVFTLWDLGHLSNLEFPELSHNREFENREFEYTKSLKKAFKVIVDSNYGKNYAIKKYNLDNKRVEVLKYLPNIRSIESDTEINIKEKYKIQGDYIFYPAQFWAHKNHIYILKAIKLLKEKNIDISVIFSGSNKGTLDYILQTAQEYQIQDLVYYVGFVDNEEIPHLYKQSLALVMPTFFGPTNIPPLEAFAYEVPVCYSDIASFREQVGDAVFFMDLKNPNSLVDNLLEIKNNKKLVLEKISKGKAVLTNWNDEDFYNGLLSLFKEYQYIRELWSNKS